MVHIGRGFLSCWLALLAVSFVWQRIIAQRQSAPTSLESSFEARTSRVPRHSNRSAATSGSVPLVAHADGTGRATAPDIMQGLATLPGRAVALDADRDLLQAPEETAERLVPHLSLPPHPRSARSATSATEAACYRGSAQRLVLPWRMERCSPTIQ